MESANLTLSKFESILCNGMLAIIDPSHVRIIPVATSGGQELYSTVSSDVETSPNPLNISEKAAHIASQSDKCISIILHNKRLSINLSKYRECIFEFKQMITT